MTGWPSVTVQQLQADGVLLVEDGNHGEYRPRPNEFVDGGTAFIRAADLVDGRVAFESAGSINEVARKRVHKGIGEPGDILFSHKGTVGKLARVPPDAPPYVCSPQTTFWRVRDPSRLCPDYLYAFMRSQIFIGQWWARKGETDMADYVSLTAQRQLQVMLPSIDTQRRIARPLVAIDSLIESNRRRIELLEQMAQEIYREWFVRFRYPGHERANLVDSSVGPVPARWEIAPIQEIAAVKYGSTLPEKQMLAGHIPVYGAAKVIGFHTVANIWEPTIVMGCRGTCGQVAITEAPAFVTNNSFTITPKLSFSQPWLFLLLQDRGVEEFISGSAQPQITLSGIAALGVLVPDCTLLRKFYSSVAPLLDLVRSLRDEQAATASIRDLLLPRLVSGQIDVSTLDLDAAVDSVT